MTREKKTADIALRSAERQAAAAAKTVQQQQMVFEEFLPIAPNSSSRYPGIFTTVPLFVPQAERRKSDTKGWDEGDADVYHAGELRIERYGPGLSIYDEDTLIAILQLCGQRRLRGTQAQVDERLKQKPNNTDPDRYVEIHAGTVTPYLVNKYLGRSKGGVQLRLCMESIKRLGLNQFTFYSDRHRKKMTGKFFEYGGGYEGTDDNVFKIDPIMVKLFRDYVEIDITLRRKLSDVGKSVHRYLSGKQDEHVIPLEDLMNAIRYGGKLKEFKRVLVDGKGDQIGQLQILVDEGWLLSYEVTGTGRKTPLMLRTVRNADVARGILRLAESDEILEDDLDSD